MKRNFFNAVSNLVKEGKVVMITVKNTIKGAFRIGQTAAVVSRTGVNWLRGERKLSRVSVESLEELEKPGVFVLFAKEIGFYVGASLNMRLRRK